MSSWIFFGVVSVLKVVLFFFVRRRINMKDKTSDESSLIHTVGQCEILLVYGAAAGREEFKNDLEDP